MIDNYKESEVTGTRHTRCKSIHILNEYGRLPVITFNEEIIHNLGSDTVSVDSESISMQVDMDATLDDGEGNTIKYSELYKWIAIAYLNAATDRDSRIEESDEQYRYKLFIDQLCSSVDNLDANEAMELVSIIEFRLGRTLEDAISIINNARGE